jgi:hypothetical protein
MITGESFDPLLSDVQAPMAFISAKLGDLRFVKTLRLITRSASSMRFASRRLCSQGPMIGTID